MLPTLASLPMFWDLRLWLLHSSTLSYHVYTFYTTIIQLQVTASFFSKNTCSYSTEMLLYIVGLMILFYAYRWIRELKQVSNKSEKYVYITGCDTGFGNLLAKHLDKEGFCVIAGCYTEKGEVELKKSCSARLSTVPLNVTDNDSIMKAAGFIKTLVGEKGKGLQLWLLFLGLDNLVTSDWWVCH